MNLAAKYRPKTLEEVTEQPLVVNILSNMCKDEKLETRNFLLVGPAGTGKTTSARACANILNNNVGEPIEIDAASHSGVEDMRQIVSQAQQYPIGTKWKIFIIDECHALSNQSWQAALKILEEQPAKSIFFFCTTNPEKIPGTILSRVQKFQLSKISLSGIESRLKYIIECENKEGRHITFTDDAIQMIAKLANGGMRDAITLMDKALAYSEDLTIENLEKSLDMPNYDDYFEFLNALARKDNTKIIDIINTVYNSGTNYVKWMENFHSFICNIIKYIFLQDIAKTMIPSTYQEKISKYGTQHAVLCLKLANKLVKLNQELKSTQYLQEYTISELCEIPAQK